LKYIKQELKGATRALWSSEISKPVVEMETATSQNCHRTRRSVTSQAGMFQLTEKTENTELII